MARTSLTKTQLGRGGFSALKTKLAEHDTALDNLEAATPGTNDYKSSVRCASTGNLALSGTSAVDGVTIIAGNRVLAKDQTTAADSGIYVVAAGAWARATDADASAEVTSGLTVFVEEGTVNAGQIYQLTTANPITLGVTALTFTKKPNSADLASTANAKGASLIGIEDSAGKITATTVEAALAEIAADSWVTGAHIGALAITTAKIAANAVTIAKTAANMFGAPQSLVGAGAIDLTTRTTLLTSTGGSQAVTIADGTETGQRKTIIHAVDGGSMVITAGGSLHLGASIATITFTNVRDWVELEWGGSVWNVVASGGCTFA
jgi:phage-related tail fiber protein